MHEEQPTGPNLYDLILDAFYEPAPNDPWAASGRTLARELWTTLRAVNVAPTQLGPWWQKLISDSFQESVSREGRFVRPFTNKELVEAFHDAAAFLRERSIAEGTADDLATRLAAVEEPEPGLAKKGENTPARQKIAEAREALSRYRSPHRDLLDQRRDFQDCVNAIYTAVSRIENELIKRARTSPGVAKSVAHRIRKIWPGMHTVEEMEPIIRWVLNARHTDNHQPADDPVLNLTGSFRAGSMEIEASSGRLVVGAGGYMYQYTNENTDRELMFIVGQAPAKVNTLQWIIASPPDHPKWKPAVPNSVEEVLDYAVGWTLDLFVKSRRPLSELVAMDDRWFSDWDPADEPA